MVTRAKLDLNTKDLRVRFDKKEELKLTKRFHLLFRDERAYVVNGITGTVQKFNQSGFFLCCEKTKNRILNTKGIIECS